MYVVARGILDRLKRWENDISAIYYPYEYKKGAPLGKLQLSIRPIQLYEVVFPESCKSEVLSTIYPSWNEDNIKFKAMQLMLRKIVGGEEIDMTNIQPNDKLYRDFVGVIPISIRKDKYDKDGIELL